ncbi:iron chelate uptake ABC transporter family permease subunit [Acinetobacter rudis]|uniref:ABC transporter permease n=1 Tax=Acinetobacter rudis TaxID=632955 RepID=UPI00280D2F26|nr:iron chelate uptake ABC transporter family permease subunit [Acinetobacter rudis]MDQ8952354.1 iron chelate uptake ABC transporter family permease subunit [Acinetobacter rudis]
MPIVFLLGFVLLSMLSLILGAQQLQWSELVNFSSETWLILTASRLPRLFAIILTGVGLAICGVILQQIVRNRFVEAGTTGGLDAARLGVLVALSLLPDVSMMGRMLFALTFCFIASLIFIAIVQRIQFRNSLLIPVIGLMYGSILAALAEFYAYQNNMLQSMQGWLLGDFSRVVQGHYELMYIIVPMVILSYIFAQRFTVIGMGNDTASSLGVNYNAMAVIGLLIVATTVAISVISVGAIPFVGLVVPHLVAMKYGDNLKKTLPIVALGGASLLLLCDIVGRLILYPFEVPIALTAGGVGGLLFFILIFRRIRT